MDKRVQKLWSDALRSGDYKQGRGVLRAGDTYCCLGVLCDIYAKETGDGAWEMDDDDNWHFEHLDEDTHLTVALPRPVVAWAAMEEANPYSSFIDEEHATQVSFIGLNDALLWSFQQIAEEVDKL